MEQQNYMQQGEKMISKLESASVPYVFPDLSSINSKKAVAFVKQMNISNKVLLGITQGIGNVIMATPLIKALTSLKLEVHVLEGGFNCGAEQVLTDMPGVKILHEDFALDHVYLLGLQSSWPRVGLEKYCAQIRSTGHFQMAWDKGVPAHEVEMNMALAYSLKYQGEVPSLYCKYETVIMNPTFGENVKYVGIHICRRYNHQFYANRALRNPEALALALFRAGFIPVILGHEDCVPEQQKENYPANTCFMDGMKLEKTAGAIRHLDCMINEDSGIMHVCAAMDTPQVAIFGPTSVVKNRPWSRKAAVIQSKLECAPCQYTEKMQTCYKNDCMGFGVEDIVDIVGTLIEKYPRKIKIGGKDDSLSRG